MAELVGNFNLTAMQQAGVVTGGFDNAPFTDMIWSPPHIARLLEANGYAPTFPMTTFRIALAEVDPSGLLGDKQRAVLDKAFALIVENNLASAPVFVHRDFMPRNLMLTDDTALGVLDFQDAVHGPITYDIASLMRDAFLSWEEDFVLDITVRYWQAARKAGLPVHEDFGDFYRAVEWMGLQRHLKVAGIFARITLRDGKPKYLADTPRFIHYIRTTASRYRELTPLLRLVDQIEGTTPQVGFAYGRV